jgi:hypothetical protein
VGDGVILTSADGLNWTAQSSATLFAVTWAGSQWVAVGSGILTSPTGAAWTAATVGTQDLLGVAWSGDQLVAVGVSGAILTSPNGTTWTARASGTTQDLSGVALDTPDNVYIDPGYWVWNGNDYDTYDSGTPGSAGVLSQGREGLSGGVIGETAKVIALFITNNQTAHPHPSHNDGIGDASSGTDRTAAAS